MNTFIDRSCLQALLHICEVWGVSPTEVVMCGDSAKDDIPCGNAAGVLACASVWLWHLISRWDLIRFLP
jgi:FMN phosphatase YigB (HAD superfamily)